MAAVIQILLPLMCVVVAEGYYMDYYGYDNYEPDHKPYPWPKEPSIDRRTSIPSSPAVSRRQSVHYRPRNRNIHSYNSKRTYDNFDPYFDYLEQFRNRNYDNMPDVTSAWSSYRNKFNTPYQFSHMSNININDEKPFETFEYTDENQEPEMSRFIHNPDTGKHNDLELLKDNQKLQNINSKTSEVKYVNYSKDEAANKVNISAEKDVFMIDNIGNNAYLSHQNVPTSVVQSNYQEAENGAVNVPVRSNSNKPQQLENQSHQVAEGPPTVYISIVANNPSSAIPTSNEPSSNTVMYIPVFTNKNNNQQQPINQNYQMFKGQQTNIPLTANRFDSIGNDRVLMNPAQSIPPWNNYSPIYIYANGQLILIPGFAINPPQNNGYQGTNIPGNIINANVANQDHPTLFPVSTTGVPILKDDSKTPFVTQNLQGVQSPVNTNDLGFYNMPDGNTYLNMMPKNKNHVPIENSLNQHPAGAVTNPVTPPAAVWGVNNNVNKYQQPSSTKDEVEEEDENW